MQKLFLPQDCSSLPIYLSNSLALLLTYYIFCTALCSWCAASLTAFIIFLSFYGSTVSTFDGSSILGLLPFLLFPVASNQLSLVFFACWLANPDKAEVAFLANVPGDTAKRKEKSEFWLFKKKKILFVAVSWPQNAYMCSAGKQGMCLLAVER